MRKFSTPHWRVIVDIGQPARGLNLVLHPTPGSVMFWDLLVLSGYLLLNVTISRVTLTAERKGEPPPAWIKPVIILTSVLMSTVGVLLGLLVFAMPFGIIMTGVGIISLAGIVVNNAIVLIDYIDILRERDGMNRREALVQGGRTRFRHGWLRCCGWGLWGGTRRWGGWTPKKSVSRRMNGSVRCRN